MGFTKNKGLSVVITLIALVVLSVLAFALPVEHTVQFWMGYSFAVFANVFLLAITLIALNKPSLNDKFHGLPVISLAWIYFIVQTVLSIWQMVNSETPYFHSVIANVAIVGVVIILTILTYASTAEIVRVEEKQQRKVFYIKSVRTEIELLATNDEKLSKRLKELGKTVRFSDPMSHSLLSDIEDDISDKIALLKESISSTDVALSLCDEIHKLFEERNKKCKLLKSVPEPKPDKENSGIKYVVSAFGVISVMIVILLVVSFFTIPGSKYNDAVSMLDNGQYEEAIVAFKELGNYRDSISKIEIAKEKICEDKYLTAEEYYENQYYIEAVRLYEELDDYKDSKDKIERIYNMFAVDEEVYFGEYKNEPIPWKILKTEKNRMLLITQSPIEQLPFNDELKNITWETSSIREWLNDKFLQGFSSKQQNRILRDTTNDINDEIFILSQEEYNTYSENVSFETDSDWWLKTKTDAGMMYVYGETGEVNTIGEGVVRAMGVRPCVWISLK